MRRKTSVAILVTTITFATVTSSSAGSLCLSDSELRAVLVGLTVRALGATIGTCARKYPELSTQALTTAKSFASKYNSEMKANERLTVDIFSQRGQGIDQRDATLKAAEKAAIDKTQGFSMKQCSDSISGLQAMVVADDFEVVRLAAQVSLNAERAHVSKCPE